MTIYSRLHVHEHNGVLTVKTRRLNILLTHCSGWSKMSNIFVKKLHTLDTLLQLRKCAENTSAQMRSFPRLATLSFIANRRKDVKSAATVGPCGTSN